MNVTEKIIATIILVVILLAAIMPTVNAISENIVQNQTEENVLYQEPNDIEHNKTKDYDNNETDAKDKEESVTSFDVLMADVLTKKEGNSFKLNDVPSIILQKPSKNGVWIEEKAREYVVNLINLLTNKVYKIDTDGYLIEDSNVTKDESDIVEKYNFYTQKIDEMISQDKLTIISISDTYKQLNTIDGDIIDIMIEDDEYGLIFKDTEEKERNRENIIILNSKNYSSENNNDIPENLFEKFLETYYNDDKEFLEYINSKKDKNEETIIENSKIDDNIVEENAEEDNVEEENEKYLVKDMLEDDKKIIKTNIFDDRVTEKDWKLILAGILSVDTKVTNDNIDKILEYKPTTAGIWIGENSRKQFLDFLNQYTIYTYSVDKNGYLICDNKMRTNENLDLIENEETDVDIVIRQIMQGDKLLVIDLSDSYLQYDKDGKIISKQISKDEYTISFSYNDNRILLLNPNYYSTTEYDLALSDYMIKSMQNIQGKVLTGEVRLKKQTNPILKSSREIIGYSASAQNVYAGPDSSNYAKIGSVGTGEKLYILGTNAGWYHIQYVITGTSNGDGVELEKAGYIPIGSLSSITKTPSEESFTGGQAYPQQGLSVQTCDDFDISTSIGSVYAGEGVTILYDYGYSDWTGKSYRVALIEYSTGSGTKRGYVYKDQLDTASYNTSVARVTDTNSAYAGPDNSYVKLGGAYYNEYVTVLAKDTGNDWVFVEYNTNSGRKRGYMSYSKLSNCNHPGSYNDLATNQGLKQATQQLTVYGGPNSNNANIGAIFNQEVVTSFGTERGYAYVEYSTTNGAKRGYVLNSALTGATPPSLPNIPTYTNFTSGTYGTSGLGQSLKYYKIGNGPNVAFAVFAQHGWEDAWAYDGIELVNIADRMMSSLSSSGINSNWTLYVIPYANPDGITNGYTNNGPGRCTVSNKVDMNRCWPTNFTPTYTSRNYTGSTPLGTPEAIALRAFIQNNMGSNGKIILDIHGWLNQTYGNAEIGQYFDNQFGFGHSSSYGSGYLMAWGKSIGAKSCLVEFPMPSSSSDIINRDFSGKLTNAIKNMLNGTSGSSSEGGTEVNELVTVTAENLNVRSGPGTSYSIVTSISQGTTVTRIRKGVANANGFTWDKIRLSNGTEGYVATNYLTLANQNIPITVEIDKGEEANKIFSRVKTWSTINPDTSAYEGICIGEDEYNKMTPAEHIVWDNELTGYNTYMLLGLIAVSSQFPNAAPGLKYFLTKGQEGKSNYQYSYVQGVYQQGHTRRNISFSTAIDQNTAVRNKLLSNIDEAIEASEKFCVNDNTTVTFYNESEDSGTAYKQSSYTDSEADWYLLVNNYRIKIQGTATRNGNTYELHMRYGLEDYYDWRVVDNRGYAEMLGDIQGLLIEEISAYLELMHKAGISRNYTNYGETNYTITWTKGNRVSTGAVYTRN